MSRPKRAPPRAGPKRAPVADSLAPDAEAFLALLAQGTQSSFRGMSVEDARAAVSQMNALFDAAPLADVGSVDGMCRADGHGIPVRCYTPAGAAGDGPIIVFAHGGGWVTGDLDGYDSFCRFLAVRSGWRVASVDYRRAPEAVFPAALDDMRSAASWIASGQSPLGPVGGIVLAGDSAGGGLVAALAAHSGAEEFDLRALLLLYPALDLSRRSPSYAAFAEGHLLTADDMDYFIASYVPDPERRLDPACSPLLGAAAASLPPVVVLTCSHDVLRDEGRAYVEACRAVGVSVRHLEAEGHVHGIATLRKVIPSGVSHLERAIGELREISTQVHERTENKMREDLI